MAIVVRLVILVGHDGMGVVQPWHKWANVWQLAVLAVGLVNWRIKKPTKCLQIRQKTTKSISLFYCTRTLWSQSDASRHIQKKKTFLSPLTTASCEACEHLPPAALQARFRRVQQRFNNTVLSSAGQQACVTKWDFMFSPMQLRMIAT